MNPIPLPFARESKGKSNAKGGGMGLVEKILTKKVVKERSLMAKLPFQIRSLFCTVLYLLGSWDRILLYLALIKLRSREGKCLCYLF